jgi:hypothetical protein
MADSMDLNIVANALNDDCLSYIFSFVNTRKLCFDFLKRKRDTILTNHILRPTIKRFTEGKYYTDSDACFLGRESFRVDKISKCFITICYWKDLLHSNELKIFKTKRRFNNDYEYFKIPDNYSHRKREEEKNTKNLIEMDKLPSWSFILYKEFDFYFKRFEYCKYIALSESRDLSHDIKEVGGEIGWVLVEIRKKEIDEINKKIIQNQHDQSNVYHYQRQVKQLIDLNKWQLDIFG